jgi:hypothetical protein
MAVMESTSGWQVIPQDDANALRPWTSVSSLRAWSGYPVDVRRAPATQQYWGDVATWRPEKRSVYASIPTATHAISSTSSPTQINSSSWQVALVRRLREIAVSNLGNNLPIPADVFTQVIRESMSLLPWRMSIPAVVPTDEGTIELEWRKSRIHLRIVFYGSAAYVWIDNHASGQFIHGSLDESREIVTDTLRQMSGE